MSPRKFYKTTVALFVLSEEPLPANIDLVDIAQECDAGSWVGSRLILQTEQINGKQVVESLAEYGSDAGFFDLDNDGNDLPSA